MSTAAARGSRRHRSGTARDTAAGRGALLSHFEASPERPIRHGGAQLSQIVKAALAPRCSAAPSTHREDSGLVWEVAEM
jgi:hypothetical protein